MKKLLTILSAVLLIFLTGCSGKEQSKTFTKSERGVTMELTYYYKGDKVTKQTANNTMEYSKLGVTKETLKATLEPVMKKYQGVEGLEESVDFQDDKAVEKLTIDYTKAKISELKGIPGIELDAKDGDSVSLKKSEEALSSQGFTEKK
ncbi:hypothetical protein HMPREF1983_00164 [Gemella bergeri ATCC 700627]|uniref:DUF1307 domain-containing protein n=1 Tax=Gemella bergeri ATCC 700627 TaxID=1321820 RepID=U2SCG3_9BACL|nr:DUF1307 domain-containing protein [Gemella bergeri]ERK60417.1 hypothetical protein HMPREF1983_00164 [Gemella bergeri ATCC 700627]